MLFKKFWDYHRIEESMSFPNNFDKVSFDKKKVLGYVNYLIKMP